MENMEPTQSASWQEKENLEISKEYIKTYEDLSSLDAKLLESKSAKYGLAFLIDRNKMKSPDAWEANIEKLRAQCDVVFEAGGRVDLSWFVSDAVSTEYIELLSQRAEEIADDEELAKKVLILKKIAEQSHDFYRKSHEEGNAVAIPGIARDYIPKWTNI